MKMIRKDVVAISRHNGNLQSRNFSQNTDRDCYLLHPRWKRNINSSKNWATEVTFAISLESALRQAMRFERQERRDRFARSNET